MDAVEPMWSGELSNKLQASLWYLQVLLPREIVILHRWTDLGQVPEAPVGTTRLSAIAVVHFRLDRHCWLIPNP